LVAQGILHINENDFGNVVFSRGGTIHFVQVSSSAMHWKAVMLRFQRHQAGRVLLDLFKVWPRIPVGSSIFPHTIHGVAPARDEGSHYLPGGSPLPLWYHPQPIPSGFDDLQNRRVTGSMHAAIDGESFVVDQPREVLEWHS
jgi:hypothetical protein